MTTLQVSAQKQLRQLIEQIERLEEEKKALQGDIRDKYLEAKGFGFDVKILRAVIRLRKLSQVERQENDSILDVYLHALGMLPDDEPGDMSPEQIRDAADATSGVSDAVRGVIAQHPTLARGALEQEADPFGGAR